MKLLALLLAAIALHPAWAYDDRRKGKQPPQAAPQQQWGMPSPYYDRQMEQLQRQQQQATQISQPAPVKYYDPPKQRWPTGPSRPPVMLEFRDKYESLVKAYVSEHSQDGFFLVRPPNGGPVLRLSFKKIKTDTLRQASAAEAVGCVEFVTALNARPVDLDIHVAKQGWDWSVGKVVIHRIGATDFLAAARRPAKAPAAASRPAAAIPKPQAPAKLTARVSFSEPSADDVLDGGELGSLTVTVENLGPGKAHHIRAVSSVSGKVPGLILPAEALLGDLEAGKSVSKTLTLQADEKVASQKVSLRIDIKEGNGFDAEASVVRFETRAFLRPRLSIAGVALAQGGLVKAGETTKIAVAVSNTGKGRAAGVVAQLETGSKDIFVSGEPTAEVGSLKPGQSKTVEFEFFVNKRFAGKELPVSVSLSEATRRFGAQSRPLGLALGKAPPRTNVVTIKGRAAGAAEEETPADDVDSLPAGRLPRDPHAYAVVIGIESYRDVPQVEHAAADARSIHAYLTGAMGFDPKNVVLLEDERATLTDLDTYLGPWLRDRVDAKSRVFVFYAGHGAPDPRTGEAFIIPYDGNPNYTDTKAYPLTRLYDGLAKLPARDVTVALDACFSGSGGRSVIAKGARPLVNMVKTAPELGPNLTVITASGADQISSSHEDGRHGLMTYFMLKGLRGEADADKDGKVTTAELFSYIQPSVERQARLQHVEQTPTITPGIGALGERARRVWTAPK